MKPTIKLLPVSLLAVALIGCSDDDDDDDSINTPTSSNIVEVATANGSFTSFVAALEATGLDDVLADDSRKFTVFAPTDSAFAELGDISGLTTENLTDILLYHVVADAEIDSATATSVAGTTLTMANNDDTGIALQDNNLSINKAVITAPDVSASNGLIHVIDSVLLPTTDNPASGTIADIVDSDGNFTILANALGTTGLSATLADVDSKFTVFAPSDSAFAGVDLSGLTNEQLSDILLYHVVSGAEINAAAATAIAGNTLNMGNGGNLALSGSQAGLFANLAGISTPDVDASNGIIHIIDKILIPPSENTAPTQTIVDIAITDGNFTKLVAALQATGLDATLSDTSAEFTVFAPTDSAFAALQSAFGLSDAELLALPNLTDILTKHVVTGSVDSLTAFTLNGTEVGTVNGETISLSINSGAFSVDESRVTMFDIRATNGIVHIIDAVILPD